MWHLIVTHLPTNDMQYGILLHTHADKQLKAMQGLLARQQKCGILRADAEGHDTAIEAEGE